MSDQIRLLSQQVIDTRYSDLADVPDRHQRLIEALRAGDPAAAEQEVRQHIDSVAERVTNRLHKRDAEGEHVVRAADSRAVTPRGSISFRARLRSSN